MSSLPLPVLERELEVDGLTLELRRFGPVDATASVLLVHGASASHETFLEPDGGLVRYLGQGGEPPFDVWTLDWRGSRHVVERLLERPPEESRDAELRRMTLDQAATKDFPMALREMERILRDGRSPGVVAHCFGAGAFSIALARGQVPSVRNVVLLTLALFYEAPWDGWVKAEDFILERVLSEAPACRAIDPRRPGDWPRAMAEAYDLWGRLWPFESGAPGDAVLSRLSFMFGAPYPKRALAPGLHGPALDRLFGPMHLGLYLHAGQLLRRGFAAPFDAPDVLDRRRRLSGGARRPRPPPKGVVEADDLTPEPFRDKAITLITGADNRLWHRDGIDSMYEWLLAHAPARGSTPRPVKHVLPGFAHQDLLWGTRRTEVYARIREGLVR
jgi:hypothetical protein